MTSGEVGGESSLGSVPRRRHIGDERKVWEGGGGDNTTGTPDRSNIAYKNS